MASAAEREIRDALVDWWRVAEPRGRVVHELPMSGFSAAGRADMGIIFPDAIVLVEIKSERDKLTRLKDQFDAMAARSHDFMAVLHSRWFDEHGDVKDQSWINWAAKEHIWRFPKPESQWAYNRYSHRSFSRLPPNPYLLLSMLWADELRAAYSHAGVMGSGKLDMHGMIMDLGQRLTGRQITRAVCAALRTRVFAEADQPVSDGA